MKLFPKPDWKNAIGASTKPKRLKLKLQANGLFSCPLGSCDSEQFKSKRGCRKHVYTKHGWYFYFDTKPDSISVLPSQLFSMKNLKKKSKSCTTKMESFTIDCSFALKFIRWLSSTGGSSKNISQANIITRKILKFLKYCCADTSCNWDIPMNVLDYCLGSVSMISDFIEHLSEKWQVGFAGIIGYLNALSHLLDYRRSEGACSLNMSSMVATEIFLSRAKKSLGKKMRQQWHHLLSVDYLNKIDCWATLQELQTVIPFHTPKFRQVVLNSQKTCVYIPSQDLTFATSFIVAVLFLMVKATRPMTFIYLTVQMIESIDESGIIDQTLFKTQEKYGFDSLVFPKDVLSVVKSYVSFVRPRLNPSSEYLLVTRNVTQITGLSAVLGRIVYLAIGKYIQPTRYRQIVETESSEKLSIEEQLILSEDQKHTSNVARVYYKKQRSQEVAKKGARCMEKLRNNSACKQNLISINSTIAENIDHETDFNMKTSEKSNIDAVPNQRKKKTPFSNIEDTFLQRGIMKHGVGRWSAILNDPEYSFDPSRKTATLQVRAKLKKFV